MNNKPLYILFLLFLTLPCCRLIDDDLSVCGTDLTFIYQTRLNTNIESEIATVLPEAEMKPVADNIRTFLAPVFQPDMYDLQLYFYLSADASLLRSSVHSVNASSAEIPLNLPEDSYTHLCVANADGNSQMSVLTADYSSSLRLRQSVADTIRSHNTGIYTGRYNLNITDDTPVSGIVPLYIINSSVALVIDSTDVSADSISVCLHGMASAFSVQDSLFSFTPHQVVAMQPIAPQCFAAICLPSSDNPKEDGAYYSLDVLVTRPDSTITQNIITINSPLMAGNLKIIRCKLLPDGRLDPEENTEVGITVTLDWKQGGQHDVITG